MSLFWIEKEPKEPKPKLTIAKNKLVLKILAYMRMSLAHVNCGSLPHMSYVLSSPHLNYACQLLSVPDIVVYVTGQCPLSIRILVNWTCKRRVSTAHINCAYQLRISTAHINCAYQLRISTADTNCASQRLMSSPICTWGGSTRGPFPRAPGTPGHRGEWRRCAAPAPATGGAPPHHPHTQPCPLDR